MALVSDDAITLDVSDYSETSQIVTLFSRHNGKLRLLAKGSKRPKNPFGGPIDRLQAVQVVFTMRAHGGLGILTELSQTDPFAGLRDDLQAFYAANYASELTLATTADVDPHEDLYELLNATLRGLSCRGDSAILVFRFEAALLRIVGLMPALGACVSCRRQRSSERGGFFSPAAGGILCRQCARDGAEGAHITGKALSALVFLSSADERATQRVRLSPHTAQEMRKLLRSYWPHVVGRPLRTLKWVS